MILWIISGWGVLHISAQETYAIEWQVDSSSVENLKVVKNEKSADIEKQNFTSSKLYQMTFVGDTSDSNWYDSQGRGYAL